MLLSHFQPGPISECVFEERQQSALKDDASDFVCCLPFLAINEATTDVDKVLNLIVSQLLVLEILSNVKGLAHLA